MIATSGEQTSLFIAPPLIIQEDELMRVLEALDHGLELADAESSGSRAEAGPKRPPSPSARGQDVKHDGAIGGRQGGARGGLERLGIEAVPLRCYRKQLEMLRGGEQLDVRRTIANERDRAVIVIDRIGPVPPLSLDQIYRERVGFTVVVGSHQLLRSWTVTTKSGLSTARTTRTRMPPA
jgi:hypothetical protein